MDHIPQPNDIYRHFKGNFYRIVTLAVHSETREQMVVYQALYGDAGVYVRPLDMFTSPVDRQKYPDADQEMRFAWCVPPQVYSAEQVNAIPVPHEDVTGRHPGRPGMTDQQPAAGSRAATTDSSAAGIGFAGTAAAPAMQETQDDTPQIDPRVMEYLDADTYEQKLRILVAMHDDVTEEMLNTMSIAIDVELKDGDTDSRYEELKYCLMTRERFECNRLR